jgi:leucyl aminopeptidase (aminopeptidase T)
VLVASDRGADPAVRDVLVAAVDAFGTPRDVVTPAPAAVPNSEPSHETTEALARCEVVMLATSVPISYTQSVRDAVRRGVRIIAMDGVTLDMLAGAAADYEAMHELALVLEQRWNEASHVRLTSEHGADLEADVSTRKSWRWDGRTFAADWYDLTGCALPDGEVGIAPLEGSASGLVVWDTSVHYSACYASRFD